MKRYKPVQFSPGIREHVKGQFIRVDDVIDELNSLSRMGEDIKGADNIVLYIDILIKHLIEGGR